MTCILNCLFNSSESFSVQMKRERRVAIADLGNLLSLSASVATAVSALFALVSSPLSAIPLCILSLIAFDFSSVCREIKAKNLNAASGALFKHDLDQALKGAHHKFIENQLKNTLLLGSLFRSLTLLNPKLFA